MNRKSSSWYKTVLYSIFERRVLILHISYIRNTFALYVYESQGKFPSPAFVTATKERETFSTGGEGQAEEEGLKIFAEEKPFKIRRPQWGRRDGGRLRDAAFSFSGVASKTKIQTDTHTHTAIYTSFVHYTRTSPWMSEIRQNCIFRIRFLFYKSWKYTCIHIKYIGIYILKY